MPSLSNRWLPA